MRFHGLKKGLAALVAMLCGALPALANEPINGQLGMQPAASAVAQQIDDFHGFLLVIITIITIFVLALLLYVILRFNSKANPTPAKFSHNTVIEVIWTAAPVMILVAIAFPSFPALFIQDVEPTTTKVSSGEVRELTEEDWVTIKTYGRQWYWTYQYDLDSEEPVEFDARMIPDADIADFPGARRNLSTDYPMVVPQGKYIRLNIAASDVIHSWAMPAFRLKTDAVPGLLNQLWFKAEKEGVYYGQCSELCGRDHAFMPIELRVVPLDVYNEWLELAREDIDVALEYIDEKAPRPLKPVQLASAQ